MICSACIERLRIAYEFKNICIQSAQTLERCMGQSNENNKSHIIPTRPLSTPTKFEFEIEPESKNSITCTIEEPQSSEYLNLKHFLDNEEELSKPTHLVEVSTSRSTSPDEASTSTRFIESNGGNRQPQILQIRTDAESNTIRVQIQTLQPVCNYIFFVGR